MNQLWDENIQEFVELAIKHQVRLVMVGGGAVNFHGYQRHSADVDFWLDIQDENLKRLVLVFQKMGYEINDFPESVKNQEQNISIKFSPLSLSIELITKFSVNKSFDEVYETAVEVLLPNQSELMWKVISYNDLITSKIKSNRPKDLLDIQELQRIKNDKKSI